MKTKFCFAIVAVGFAFPLVGQTENPSGDVTSNKPEFRNLADLKWDKLLPGLGPDSPEICFLHIDPKTHATSLLIRTPKGIYVRKHWHSANETHTLITGTATFACEGKRVEMGPGDFNYMPARMVHEAWLPANALTFITVGWRLGRELGRGSAD